MKTLKEISEYDRICIVPARLYTYSIEPLTVTSIFDDDDGLLTSFRVSNGHQIIRLSVSNNALLNGKSVLRVLGSSDKDYEDYMICADEETAREYIRKEMCQHEEMLKVDIVKTKNTLKRKKRELYELRQLRRKMKL